MDPQYMPDVYEYYQPDCDSYDKAVATYDDEEANHD